MPRKIIGFLIVGFLFASQAAYGDTLYFKNGKTIRAKVVEQTADQIKVDISGVKITYYLDEIDHIEKDNEAAPIPPKPITDKSTNVSPITPTTTSSTTPTPSTSDTSAVSATADKKELILTLIDASGTRKTMTDMFDQIMLQAPEQQKTTLKSILNINEIISRLVPIYDKYFTETELKELIAFYRSTTGRKLIKVMPMIMEDSMKASMTYFQEKMPNANAKAVSPPGPSK